METNLKVIAQQICTVVGGASEVDVDASDVSVQQEGESYTFECIKWHDRIVPGRRGPGSHEPIGRIHYKVTVTARYEPFE